MARTILSKKENHPQFKSNIKNQISKTYLKNKKVLEPPLNFLIKFGTLLLILGLMLFILIFYRALWQEVKYNFVKLTNNTNKPIKPIDEEFGIVIPKIRANAKVITNVDPFDSKVYQWALTKGVAHAKGTAFPGHAGNTFIFAHSSVDWYIANRYNSVFYLLHRMEKGDKIEIYYKKKKYVYEVIDKKLVKSSDVSYLSASTKSGSVLTLMTCWPPGTSLKRLIIQAKINVN